MTFASIKNKSGNFILPSLESTTLAAQTKIPADTKVSLTNTDAPNGYPIASFTWLIVYKEQDYEKRDKNKINALVDLLWWIVTDGQVFTTQLEYAPLSKEAQDKAKAIVKSITYQKKPVKK
jgi:phosphate transport system substrate-binding protein